MWVVASGTIPRGVDANHPAKQKINFSCVGRLKRTMLSGICLLYYTVLFVKCELLYPTDWVIYCFL
jgi:hypothetical protein